MSSASRSASRLDLVGRQARQAHQLDEVATVLAVGAQGQAAHPRIVRRQPEDVAEVLVRPAPLGRPGAVRGLRQAPDDRPADAGRQDAQQPGRAAVAGDGRPLDEPRARLAAAPVRRFELPLALGHRRGGGHLGLAAGHPPERPLGRRLGPDQRLVVLAADERLDPVERDVVVDLHRRALHEVARRGATSVPFRPRSRPSFRQRMASVMTPALLGLSQTSSLSSALSGTSP